MTIRQRITSADRRNNTGLRVLGFLVANGTERTFAQRCIGHLILKLWSLNMPRDNIADVELDLRYSVMLVLTADGTVHTLSLADIL